MEEAPSQITVEEAEEVYFWMWREHGKGPRAGRQGGNQGRPNRLPEPGPGALKHGRGGQLAPAWRTESLEPDSQHGSWPTVLKLEENREGSEGGGWVGVWPQGSPQNRRDSQASSSS